jgi:hypothetical protein
MKAGKCDAGKELLRAYYRRQWGASGTPDAIENMVKTQASMHCPK